MFLLHIHKKENLITTFLRIEWIQKVCFIVIELISPFHTNTHTLHCEKLNILYKVISLYGKNDHSHLKESLYVAINCVYWEVKRFSFLTNK